MNKLYGLPPAGSKYFLGKQLHGCAFSTYIRAVPPAPTELHIEDVSSQGVYYRHHDVQREHEESYQRF